MQQSKGLVSRGCKESFDKRNGTRDIPKLQRGDWVRAKLDKKKEWTTEANVVGEDQSPKSYIIDTGELRLQRNHRHLSKTPTPTCNDTWGDDSQILDISSGPTPKIVQVANANVSESSNTSPDTNYQNVADSLGNLFVIERTFSINLLSLPKDNLCLKLSLFRIQNMLKLLIQPAYFVSFFSKMGTNCVQNGDNGHFTEVGRDCLKDEPHSRFWA